MSRLLITGSRAHQWTPYDSHALLIAVREILEKTHELPVLVHGGATGADTDAARMGQQLLNLPTEVHRADWTKYGRAAGPRGLLRLALWPCGPTSVHFASKQVPHPSR